MSETTRPPIQRVAVLIPTYNERDTLPVIVARLREVVPDADLVVLDDHSPDGTGAIADELAADDSEGGPMPKTMTAMMWSRLSDEQIEQVRCWIDEGAPND